MDPKEIRKAAAGVGAAGIVIGTLVMHADGTIGPKRLNSLDAITHVATRWRPEGSA